MAASSVVGSLGVVGEVGRARPGSHHHACHPPSNNLGKERRDCAWRQIVPTPEMPYHAPQVCRAAPACRRFRLFLLSKMVMAKTGLVARGGTGENVMARRPAGLALLLQQ